jgi:hypothetical protein
MQRAVLLIVLALPVASACGTDDPAALVTKLGAKSFAEREAASKTLRELGVPALPAVTAGCTSTDAEISGRCKALLVQLRADWRNTFATAYRADKEGKRKHEHPVWDRFVSLVGDTPAGRKLFAEMIARADNFARLDDATADPARAAVQYAEVVRTISAAWDQLMSYSFHVEVWPGESPAELATLLYLGAGFSGDLRPAGPDTGTFHLPIWVACKPLRGSMGAPIAKLFVAWLDRRADAELVRSGLDVIFCQNIADGLPLARRIAADTEMPVTTRAAALPVLGRFGTVKDLPACTALLDDDSVFASFDTNGYLPRGTPVQKRTVQVRDVAAAVALTLRGADPRTHGFTAADDPVWRECLLSRFESSATHQMSERAPGTSKAVPKEVLLWPPAHGFTTADERTAAHAKAATWLAAQAK